MHVSYAGHVHYELTLNVESRYNLIDSELLAIITYGPVARVVHTHSEPRKQN